MAAESGDEDDYMTMAIPEAPSATKKSSLSRAEQLRRQRQDQQNAQRSKKDLEFDRLKRLERGLRTNVGADKDDNDWGESDTTAKKANKGAAMLAKLGYKGGPLGRPEAEASTATTGDGNEPTQKQSTRRERLLKPIHVQVKNNKFGIGAADEEEPGMKRARKALDDEQERIKRLRAGMGDFRERTAKESSEKKVEGQWWGAMRVGETLEEQANEQKVSDGSKVEERDVPLVLMPLVKQKEEQDQAKKLARAKAALHERREEGQDDDDKVAMGETLDALPGSEGGEDDDDEREARYEDYIASPVVERLDRAIMFLREKYRYCFWCKSRYDDAAMDGCPGPFEDDHD